MAGFLKTLFLFYFFVFVLISHLALLHCAGQDELSFIKHSDKLICPVVFISFRIITLLPWTSFRLVHQATQGNTWLNSWKVRYPSFAITYWCRIKFVRHAFEILNSFPTSVVNVFVISGYISFLAEIVCLGYAHQRFLLNPNFSLCLIVTILLRPRSWR